MNTKALLSCPWCGGPGELYPDGDMEGHVVMCMSPACHSGLGVHQSDELAIEAWNTRANPWLLIATAPIDAPILVASRMSAPCVAELRSSGACDDREGRGLVPTHYMLIPALPDQAEVAAPPDEPSPPEDHWLYHAGQKP